MRRGCRSTLAPSDPLGHSCPSCLSLNHHEEVTHVLPGQRTVTLPSRTELPAPEPTGMLRALLKWSADRRAWNREHLQAWARATEPTESGLSRFQLMCESTIVEALRSSGVGLTERAVVGEALMVKLTGTRWTLIIHPRVATVTYGETTLVRVKQREARTPAEFIAVFVDRALSSVWN